MQLTIITGLSGAGRSCALRTVEDLGFFCGDNIPPVLIPEFVRLAGERAHPPEHVAVVTDLRTGDMFDQIYAALDELRDMQVDVDIVFLDATDEVLISRFKETRRMHPVSGSGKIISGILAEREALQRIKEMANFVLDTSTYSPKKLAAALTSRYAQHRDSRLLISVITFGHKRGVPMDADMLFDMRFLPNPFYEPDLRAKTGLDAAVRDYVFAHPAAELFLNQTVEMVELVEPLYLEQDKKQLVIGVGCTGGMHRSVAVGEALYARLLERDHRVSIEHRDMSLERDHVLQRFSDCV